MHLLQEIFLNFFKDIQGIERLEDPKGVMNLMMFHHQVFWVIFTLAFGNGTKS